MTKIEKLIVDETNKEEGDIINFFYDISSNEYYIIFANAKIKILKMGNPLESPSFHKKEYEIGQLSSNQKITNMITSNLSNLTLFSIDKKIYLEKIDEAITDQENKINFQLLGSPETSYSPIKIKFHPLNQELVCVLSEKNNFKIFNANKNIEDPIFSRNFRFDLTEKIVDFAFCQSKKLHIEKMEDFHLFLLTEKNTIHFYTPILIANLKFSDCFLEKIEEKFKNIAKIDFNYSCLFDQFKNDCVEYYENCLTNVDDAEYIFNDSSQQKMRYLMSVSNFELPVQVFLFDVVGVENFGTFIVIGMMNQKNIIGKIIFYLIPQEITKFEENKYEPILMKEIEFEFESQSEPKCSSSEMKVFILTKYKLLMIDYSFLTKNKFDLKTKKEYLQSLLQSFQNCFYSIDNFEEINFFGVCSFSDFSIRVLGRNKDSHAIVIFNAQFQKKVKSNLNEKEHNQKSKDLSSKLSFFDNMKSPEMDSFNKKSKSAFDSDLESILKETQEVKDKMSLLIGSNDQKYDKNKSFEDIFQKVDNLNKKQELAMKSIKKDVERQYHTSYQLANNSEWIHKTTHKLETFKTTALESFDILKKRNDYAKKRFIVIYSKLIESNKVWENEKNLLLEEFGTMTQTEMNAHYEDEIKLVFLIDYKKNEKKQLGKK